MDSFDGAVATSPMLVGMSLSFVSRDQALLDSRFPLSLAAPFTRGQASAAGIHSSELAELVRRGLVRRLVAGVYAAAQVPDSLGLRVAALRLVVPAGAVVTDRTAGWLHGASMILAPGDHLVVPAVSVFVRARGGRLRNGLVASGQRIVPERDVVHIDGLAVTTPLRTACDLGRLLRRDQAFAALDAMLRLGLFTQGELVDASSGYRGYRWVRQLRALAPLADARAESPGESVLRLRWLDCPALPRPELQVPVANPRGGVYWLDLGVEELRFAAEYDGEEFHRPDDAPRDEARRTWITERLGWTMRVATAVNVHGRHRDIEGVLHEGVREARAAYRNRRPLI